VAAVGRERDLRVAPEVGDALGHGPPPPRAVSLGVGLDAQDFELARNIDRGFDPEHAAFVVHLDAVPLHPVLDPATFRSALEIGAHLSFEMAVEPTPRKRNMSSAPNTLAAWSTSEGASAFRLLRSLNMMSVAYSAWSATQ